MHLEDNMMTCVVNTDTAVVDYISEDNVAEPRHIFRLASMAEVPVSVGKQK